MQVVAEAGEEAGVREEVREEDSTQRVPCLAKLSPELSSLPLRRQVTARLVAWRLAL